MKSSVIIKPVDIMRFDIADSFVVWMSEIELSTNVEVVLVDFMLFSIFVILNIPSKIRGHTMWLHELEYMSIMINFRYKLSTHACEIVV